MPLISPDKGEQQKEFLSRCMVDKSMKKEFPESKQRLGVCFSQFRKNKKFGEK